MLSTFELFGNATFRCFWRRKSYRNKEVAVLTRKSDIVFDADFGTMFSARPTKNKQLNI